MSNPQCARCGEEFNPQRLALGYRLCMPCGTHATKKIKRTVVPMNKSNYILVTDRAILRQLNPKYQGATT